MFCSGTKKQTQIDEKFPSECMRNKRTSMNYGGRKLELQYKSVSAYLQACVVPKDHYASVLLTAIYVKFHGRVVFIASTLSKLCLSPIKVTKLKTSCNC